MLKPTLSALLISLAAFGGVSASHAKDQVAMPSPAADHTAAMRDALQASRQWIEHFNAGNAQACADAYAEQAVMEAKPFGTFTGQAAIRAFWTDLINQKGAKDLRYTNIKVEMVDAQTMLLSADWRMNIGGGHISRERWVEHKGRWVLAEDRFAVLFQTP